LLDMVRSMLSHVDLLKSLWGHALLTAAYNLIEFHPKWWKRHHMIYGMVENPM